MAEQSVVDRFWMKVYRDGPDGWWPHECWPYLGALTQNGYGAGGAYRTAYLFAKGEIADGLCVCHSCDFRPCCNPAHLSLGTHRENMQDKAKKKRGRGQENSRFFWSDPRYTDLRALKTRVSDLAWKRRKNYPEDPLSLVPFRESMLHEYQSVMSAPPLFAD